MTIKNIIKKSNINKKEAVLLVSFILNKPKEFIIAHDDLEISNDQIKDIKKLFFRRQKSEPIAYLLKQKEFYGRTFEVNKNVLIPRSETETIIDLVKNIYKDNSKIIDIGTGSGCIAITLKLECPNLDITATDINKKALTTARNNSKNLKTDIDFLKSDLLKNIPKYTKYDIIIANLPYVNKEWSTLKDIEYEPKTALFAKDNGLKTVKQLVRQSSEYLQPNGKIILELDPCQHEEITEFAKENGLQLYKVVDYIISFTFSKK